MQIRLVMKEGENKHVIRFRLNFREVYDKGVTYVILDNMNKTAFSCQQFANSIRHEKRGKQTCYPFPAEFSRNF